MSMYCLVWKYKVSSNQSDFESEYSRNGKWFKFFESCDDYLGQELLKHADGQTYVLLDKWMSKADYEDFIDEHQAEYDDLKEKNKALYDEEESMGEFDLLQ